MRRITTLAAAALMCAALSGAPARAAVTEIVAGPGSQAIGSYATPVVVTTVGGPLTFLNQDVQPHNVISDSFGPSTQPWCGFFTAGKCPLLWSRTADAGGRTQPVLGLENTTSGIAYALHCSLHPVVRATLITL